MRALLFALGLFAVSGCASEEAEQPTDDEQELSSWQLRDLAHIQKSVLGEGVADVEYKPVSPGYSGPIPFEGVNVALDRSRWVDVEVRGEFPSSARVYVVDSEFNILASTRTNRVSTSGLRPLNAQQIGRAAVRVRMPADSQILVRDSRWDRQMNFQIGIRPR